jgi:hypothetical protein
MRSIFHLPLFLLLILTSACGIPKKDTHLSKIKTLEAKNEKLETENTILKNKNKSFRTLRDENKVLKEFLSKNMPVLLAFQKSKKDFASIDKYLKNPNPGISLPAIKFYLSLEDIKIEDKIKLLEHLALSSVPEISESAFRFISKTHKSPKLRQAVLFRLSKGYKSAFSYALTASKYWQDSEMQTAVIRLLSLNKVSATQPELSEQRKARFLGIKNCLEVLGYFKNEKSLRELRPFLTRELYKALVPVTLSAIKRIDLPSLNAELIALAIDKKTEAGLRSSAVSVLYGISANQFKSEASKETKGLIRDLFLKLINNKSNAIRLQVIIGMGRLRYPEFKMPLLKLLKLSPNALEQEYLAVSLIKIDALFAAKEIIALAKLDKFYAPLRDFAAETFKNDAALFFLAYAAKKYVFCLKLWNDKDPRLILHRKEASLFKSLSFRQALLLSYWATGRLKEGQLRLNTIIPAIVKAKEPARLYDIASFLHSLGQTEAVLKSIDPIIKNVPLKSNLLYFQARRLKIECAIQAKDKKIPAIESEIKILLKQIPIRDKKFSKERKLLLAIQENLKTEKQE